MKASINPNTVPKVLGRLLFYLAVLTALPVAALIIDPYSHATAQVLASVWFYSGVVVCFMSRPPCYYRSYRSWYADRANWWKRFPPV